MVRTISETLLTQLLQFFIYLRDSDCTALHVHHVSAVLCKKTNTTMLGVHGDSISESVRTPAGDRRRDRDVRKVSDSLQEFAHLASLEFELMPVRDVLVVASPTTAKIGTQRLNPFRRISKHLPQFRAVEFMLLLDDLYLHSLAVDRQGHKNDFSSCPRHAGAAERDVFNEKLGAMMRVRIWRSGLFDTLRNVVGPGRDNCLRLET